MRDDSDDRSEAQMPPASIQRPQVDADVSSAQQYISKQASKAGPSSVCALRTPRMFLPPGCDHQYVCMFIWYAYVSKTLPKILQKSPRKSSKILQNTKKILKTYKSQKSVTNATLFSIYYCMSIRYVRRKLPNTLFIYTQVAQ